MPKFKFKYWLLAFIFASGLVVAGVAAGFFMHNYFEGKSAEQALELKNEVVKEPVKEDTKPKKMNSAPEKPTQKKKQSLKSIVQNSEQKVVQLQYETPYGVVLGSGFLYNDKGDIVTNAHVVFGTKHVKVITKDGTEHDGKVIGISDKTDVALVRSKELAGKGHLNIDRNGRTNTGDEVIALGSPLGLQNTVSTGIISGVNRSFYLDTYLYENVYQISAPISNGSSGGPLLRKDDGYVIGINSAGYQGESIGFSIPMASVAHLIDGWSKNPMTLPDYDEPVITEDWYDGWYYEDEYGDDWYDDGWVDDDWDDDDDYVDEYWDDEYDMDYDWDYDEDNEWIVEDEDDEEYNDDYNDDYEQDVYDSDERYNDVDDESDGYNQ